MNRKRAAWIVAVILWALLLLPFFGGARGAHPATDDFTFATYTHPTWLATGSLPHVIKDAVSYALRTWRDWQGTVTGVIVMALNPAVFSLEGYGAHAVILLLLQLAADFVFLRHMLGRRLRLPREVWLSLTLILSAMRLIFLPDIVEGIYWFNGAWFYTGAMAVALLTLTLADHWSGAKGRGAARIAQGALACGLLFALGMDNYMTAMMTAAALLMLAMARACAARRRAVGCFGRIRWAADGSIADSEERTFGGEEERSAQRRAAKRAALLLIPICAGLLLSVVAPGNAVRMAADGAHESGMGYALLSIGLTARAALAYAARFLLRTPLLGTLILATPRIARGLGDVPELRHRCPPVLATAAGFYLILCAMIVPHMYASGYAGSGRVMNMYHGYVLLAAPIAWTMMLARLKPKMLARFSSARAKDACAALFVVTLVIWLAGGQLGNYGKLVRDQLDGTQEAYIAQFQNEYALCAAAGPEDDVVLPAWTVQTLTGKPTAYEDATVWTNESMARYFGVRSVRVGEQSDMP